MVVNITFDTKEKEEPGDVATFTYDLYQKNKSLASVTKLKELTDAIKTAMSGVTTAEQFFKANRNNQDARIDYLDSKTTLKQKEKDYKDYLDVSDVKFKVEAFLTEKKNKTRIQKTFTVTENGIN